MSFTSLFTVPMIMGFILILITLYIIVYVIYPGSGNNNILSVMTPLNKRTGILSSTITQPKILGSSGSTVMGFFKLDSGDRTAVHKDSFIPLLYITDNWYLEISPKPIKNISARLRVITTDGNKKTYEIIELPEIPKQKWVFIAILRDGRRFDIIYDNKIMASQRVVDYPVNILNELYVGNKQLYGSVIHVMINEKRLSPLDVERERVKYVDTNNTILEDNLIDMTLPGLKIFGQCPPGLPCDPITRPPTDKLYQWKTPYA